MIQDIYPHIFRNQFIQNKKAEPDDTVLHFRGQGEILVKDQTQQIEFPTLRELFPTAADAYLFTVDDEDYYLCREADIAVPEGYVYRSVKSLRNMQDGPRYRVFSAYTAFQLSNWYRDNQFCGTCGHPTVAAKDERAIDCPACRRRIYPRIIPAVIVGVTDGDRLLLTRYANRPFTAQALIAGFTEIGETLEETVAREVMEEAGLRVKNLRYYKSQPWGIVDDILTGFYCDVDGSSEIRLDINELREAVWTERKDIQGQPDDYSLTNEMMITFRDGKEPR